jgi:uncharacterized protein with PQ loop repeat
MSSLLRHKLDFPTAVVCTVLTVVLTFSFMVQANSLKPSKKIEEVSSPVVFDEIIKFKTIEAQTFLIQSPNKRYRISMHARDGGATLSISGPEKTIAVQVEEDEVKVSKSGTDGTYKEIYREGDSR